MSSHYSRTQYWLAVGLTTDARRQQTSVFVYPASETIEPLRVAADFDEAFLGFGHVAVKVARVEPPQSWDEFVVTREMLPKGERT